MKTGTPIMVSRFDFAAKAWVYDQPAKIGRLHPGWKGQTVPEGYHPITYADGGKAMAHESTFRVV
jgi:hypothetical protein